MKNEKVKAVLRNMPELKHWPNRTNNFRIEDSEVVAWMIEQPDIKQWLYNQMICSGCCRYNSETGTWKGVLS